MNLPPLICVHQKRVFSSHRRPEFGQVRPFSKDCRHFSLFLILRKAAKRSAQPKCQAETSTKRGRNRQHQCRQYRAGSIEIDMFSFVLYVSFLSPLLPVSSYYIASGADNPTTCRPLRNTVFSPRHKMSRAAVNSASSLITLCLL